MVTVGGSMGVTGDETMVVTGDETMVTGDGSMVTGDGTMGITGDETMVTGVESECDLSQFTAAVVLSISVSPSEQTPESVYNLEEMK